MNTNHLEIILCELDLLFEKEKTYDDLKYINKLRFDYYLPQHNVLIEMQGQQHYEYIEYFHKTENKFKEQLIKDQLKKNYCEINNITLIEIRYSDSKKDVIHKLLSVIDNVKIILPHIDRFIDLYNSKNIYLNTLYDQYIKFLKKLHISINVSYVMFKEYIIDKLNLEFEIIDLIDQYPVEIYKNNSYVSTDELLKESDPVYQFYMDVIKDDDKLLSNELIPINHLNKAFKIWAENMSYKSALSMAPRTFSTRIEEYMNEFNYRRLKKNNNEINLRPSTAQNNKQYDPYTLFSDNDVDYVMDQLNYYTDYFKKEVDLTEDLTLNE